MSSLLAEGLAASAVSYIRVSTKDQAFRGGLAEGLSLPAQRSAIKGKAEAIGANIVQEFVEAGESAKTADRPELQRMLAYIRANRIQYVIVHKLDRLARNRYDDVTINLAIREAGARLISVSENVDETPQGQLVHGIFSSVAEFYSKNLAQEVVKGMEEKVRQGGTPTRAPVGYLNVRTVVHGREARVIQLDPDRAHHIRWAFEEYASNPDMTLSRITELLEARGLTIKATAKQAERPLLRSQVHRMLTNRYYAGYVTWRDVEYPGTHQAIIDEALFGAVQERLAGNRAAGNRERKHLHYLTGSLYCGPCGSRMIYSQSRGRGGLYEYFVCSSRHTKSNDCQAPYVAVEKIEEAVGALWTTEQEPWRAAVLPQVRQRLREQLQVLQAGAHADRTGLQKRIDKIRRDRYKWAENAMDGVVPPDIAREKQEQLARQLASLEGELEALERAGIDTQATLDAVLDLITDPAPTYQQLGDPDRRRFNQAWFSRIYIDIVSEEPDGTPATSGERSVFANALQASRQLAALSLQDDNQEPPGSCEPGGLVRTMGSSAEPLVELRGLEPLTLCMPCRCATSCATAPLPAASRPGNTRNTRHTRPVARNRGQARSQAPMGRTGPVCGEAVRL